MQTFGSFNMQKGSSKFLFLLTTAQNLKQKLRRPQCLSKNLVKDKDGEYINLLIYYKPDSDPNHTLNIIKVKYTQINQTQQRPLFNIGEN
jgi:tagatose-1,6-bisphosphate aldolase